jgi:hypothetical protein
MAPEVGRVYRANGGWAWWSRACGLLLCTGSCIGLWFASHHPKSQIRIVGVLVCLAFLLLAVCEIARLSRWRLVLTGSAIEIRGLLVTQLVQRQEIAGRRWINARAGNPSYFVLVLHGVRRKQVRIPLTFQPDKIFWRWVGDLPDLDLADLQASEREIRESREIGNSEEARLRALKIANRLVNRVEAVAGVLAAWALFYPRPYTWIIALLISFPWIVLVVVARSRGIIQLDAIPNSVRPHLVLSFLGPSSLLALRATLDIEHIGWQGPLLIGLLFGAAQWFCAASADRSIRQRRGTAATLFIFSVWYGYGAAMELNVLLDSGPATVYRATVLDKHVYSGKYAQHKLKLSQWGPMQDGEEVNTSPTVYAVLRPGDLACILMRNGALGIKWYTTRACK